MKFIPAFMLLLLNSILMLMNEIGKAKDGVEGASILIFCTMCVCFTIAFSAKQEKQS